jgi:cation transport ATPase
MSWADELERQIARRVALAARGATASSEAADVVLTVDRVDALADAILIARRSKGIALQAVLA